MTDDEFIKIAQETIDNLPEEFAQKLNNVSVVVQDYPSFYQVKKAKIPEYSLLLGLYEGVPQTKRGIYYSNIPDKITIFKKAIEKIAVTKEKMKNQIRKTVIHEIGHHFGLSEEELR